MPAGPLRSGCDITFLCVTALSFKNQENYSFPLLQFEPSSLCYLLWSSPVVNGFRSFHFSIRVCTLLKAAAICFLHLFSVRILSFRTPSSLSSQLTESKGWQTVCFCECSSMLQAVLVSLLSERQHMCAVFPQGSQKKETSETHNPWGLTLFSFFFSLGWGMS